MIRRWWHNLQDSFTYLNDKDIKWLKANDWFCKDIQDFPKSNFSLVVLLVAIGWIPPLFVVLFCILMVHLARVVTSSPISLSELVATLIFGSYCIVLITFPLKYQVRLLKIYLWFRSHSSIPSAILPMLINTKPVKPYGKGVTIGFTASMKPSTNRVPTIRRTAPIMIAQTATRILRSIKNLRAKV
jgi:hypothetical protein